MDPVDKNEFYRQATFRIFGSLNIETALHQCREYLSRFMPVSGLLFVTHDPASKTFKITAGIWPPHFNMPKRATMIPPQWWRKMEKAEQRDKHKLRNVMITNSFKEFSELINADPEETASFLRTIYPVEVSQIRLGLLMESSRHGGLMTYSEGEDLYCEEMENIRHGGLLIFAEGKNLYREAHAELIALLQKPFSIAMSNILQHQEILRLKEILSDDNTYLRQQMVKMSGDTVIGADTGLRDVMEMVRQVARLDSPVLLLGETGVGKEVIANALHYSSKRKDGPFIKVNCGAIPESLMDSELFGHEKGAFTGAISRKRGRFERAHGGTIFLDEIGELPLAAQVRLLRVVQHREIERVGGTETLPVDVRIISATHRSMEALVRSGKFREDLWYRLNVFPIMIPPLRQRVEDIPALAEHFLEMKSKELKIGDIPTASGDIIRRLSNYPWPGNVRELENFVERALIRGKLETGDMFQPEETPQFPSSDEGVAQTIAPLDKAMAAHIQKALNAAAGRIHGPKGAARILEVNPSTLRSRMLKLGIQYKHSS